MELTLSEILQSNKGNFYLLISRERDLDIFVSKYMDRASSDLYIARIMRGNRCTSTDTLFQEFGAALQFPYWFGNHWQSFDDCITDLSWLNSKNYIFILTNFNEVLANNAYELKTFFIFIKDAIVEWSKENKGRPIQHPVPFNMIFHCEPENEEKCKEILKKQNIHPILKILKPYDDIL